MKTMKKVGLFAVLICSSLFISCGNMGGKSEETKKESEMVRDSFNRVFTETLKDINSNLEVINENERVIMLGPNSPLEKNISEKERIIRNIHFINSLLADSKEKIALLDQRVKEFMAREKLATKQLNSFRAENQKIEKLMSSLESRLRDYEGELASLKAELSTKSFQVIELGEKLNLSETNKELIQQYSDKYEKLAYTAYVAEGNSKKLKEQGIIERGNMISRVMGKDKLSENFQTKNFQAIDIRNVTSIPINSRNAKLITEHPSRSYELKRSGNRITSIEVKDPEEFWKTSKYLVVETY